MTADISRHSLRPEQQYTQVVHQQGRPPLDADLNEGYDLAGLMLRETVAEAICTKGSPDEGFKITPPVTPSAQAGLDFNIAQGNYFLAGSRINSPGVSYRSQPDWLTFLLDDPGPDLPASGQERLDLIYVEAREQVVGATEDAELLEPGLGGPDSAARRRLMWRVQVMENVSGECADAMDQLVAQRYPGGQLDADRCTIESNAILTIGFTKLDPLEELCRPSAQAGFLGARNETFRLQVSAPGRFVWSRDNAAPLYRVQVANDENGQPRKLVFLNSPRDEFGWPQAGMTVELMRWGALLDNGEKAAEPLGLFMSVSNGYDTSDDSILVSSDVPAPWTQWFSTPEGQAAINPRDPAEEGAYFFLRVWTGGGQAGAVDHAMNPGNPVVLGETGLTATFSGIGIPGDYWIISARPNTPTSVLPWALLDGAPPRGPRRLLAPLALLNWKGPAPGEPRDCRNRFRPLCRIGGCCVITVGDGLNSYGDFTSIQQAVNHLPDDGGMICIHAGDYQEHVTIFNKQNITITGCGRNTRWQGETDNTKALLDIRDSSGIIVRSLAMTGTASESIMAHKVPIPTQKSPLPLEDLLLEDLEITASDVGAIAGLDGKGIVIRRCHISLEKLSAGLNDSDVIGRAAAIFLAGEDLTVENCRIEAAEIKDSLRLPVGGIHIGGGSEQVIIRDNVIQGGNGHGISLGSIQYVPPQGPEVNSDSIKPKREFTSNPKKAVMNNSHFYGYAVGVDTSGCVKLPGTPPPVTEVPADTPILPESSGLVSQVRILRNRISGMGFSGISAHVFAGLGADDQGFGDAVAVESIEINGNIIQGNVSNSIGQLDPLLRQFVGWGGIALSICSDATIRDNIISGNGSDSAEPVSGIFLAIAEDVKIERNRIEQNGREPQSGVALFAGRRGGIIIGIALGGVSTYGTAADARRKVDRPALLVAGNSVDAPNARALKAIALGPVIVTGNRLTGAGRSAFASNVFGSLLAAGLTLSLVGGQILDPKADIDLLDYVLLEILSDILGGDVVNLISLSVAEDFLLASLKEEKLYSPQRLTGGEMMVNNNQISLQRHSAELPVNLSSVLLLSADDISFCDNQAEVENTIAFTLTDVLTIGATLRVSSNRLQKGLLTGILSAITVGVMNQTSMNQSTHCILAVGLPQTRVVAGNTSLIDLSPTFSCAAIEKIALSLSARYGKIKGFAQ